MTQWQQVSDSWVWIPRQPIGIVHFLGGAFVGSAPNLTYRWLLEELGKEGYVIIATPFVNTLDHKAIARTTLNRFENIVERLQANYAIPKGYLPIYGIGHSMGSKLHLLIGSFFAVERAGNILLSFNNYPLRRAIPFIESLEIDTALNLEFTPSPPITLSLIAENYRISRNLLVKFNNDDIDENLTLKPVLDNLFPEMTFLLTLPGNHLTPMAQDINWQVGEVFSPLDAIAQWVKQGFSRDLYRLKQEIVRWLHPTRMVG
jgi:hypothetical protein